jgi:hypothetical protein
LNISNALDAGADIPERTARHLAECPKCRAFLTRTRRLDARLARSQPHPRPEPDPGLHARIMRGVHAASNAGRSELNTMTRGTPRLAWAGGALVLLLAATLAVVSLRFPRSPRPGGHEPPAVLGAADLLSEAASANPVVFSNRLDQALRDQYTREVRALQKDIRNAADFLVRCVDG